MFGNGIDEKTKETMGVLLNECFQRGGGTFSRAFSNNDFFGASRVCSICFTFTVDNAVQGDVLSYLADTKPPSGTKTYLESLSDGENGKKAYIDYGTLFRLIPSNNEFSLEAGKEYTVFFIGNKKGKSSNLVAQAGNLVNGDLLTFMLDNNDQYFSYAVESSRLGEVCERTVN